ncbi:MAG: hypothetical protein Q8M31_23760 [Beijerinckiaceae bacterium]|nr:hypothetical protein [Beijerinckiaceae bacterium]
MRRMLETRLAKLEAAHAALPVDRKVHTMIIDDSEHFDEESDAQIAALVASGAAAESDLFIVHRIVTPASVAGRRLREAA